MNRTAIACTAIAAFAVVAAAIALGPLNPPNGAVTSTNKTLSEVEPRIAVNATNTPGTATSLFRISAPGSYYLTGNITGVTGKHGIEIAASGVTLDLNGFDLNGVPGSLDGVIVSVTALSNITVIHGSVRNWGDSGLDLGSSSVRNCRVEGVSASDNTDTGISISTGSGNMVLNCLAFNNGGSGIFANSGSVISNCVANSNGFNGIGTGQASIVTNCTSYSNGANGISVGTGCTVTDCASRLNTADGIVCLSACLIRGNTCSSNGNGGDGAGIRASSIDNRIEGNSCTGADRGIDVDNFGNVIIRNTCSGNTTDWNIGANNIYGPIIDRRIPSPLASTPAVTGTAAASTLGSTDPNANFTY